MNMSLNNMCEGDVPAQSSIYSFVLYTTSLTLGRIYSLRHIFVGIMFDVAY